MWIESHTELLKHTKTTELMRLLHLNNRHTALGLIHAFWWWCLDNAPDGNLEGVDPEDIAKGCLWTEGGHILLMALKKAGFVDAENTVHDWHQYTGRLVEQRTQDAERKRLAYRKISSGEMQMQELSTELSTAKSLNGGGFYGEVENNGENQDFSAGEKREVFYTDNQSTYDNTSTLTYTDIRSNNLSHTVQQDGTNDKAAFEQFFTVFWRNYPARKGRKVGKAQVKAWLFKNLRPHEYQPMLKAVRNYADNCGDYARDPIRFVRDNWWGDWLDTPQAGAAANGPLDINKYKYGKYAHLFNHDDEQDS